MRILRTNPAAVRAKLLAMALVLIAGMPLGAPMARAAGNLLVLADGVPAGLDVDGPSIGYQPSYTAMLNMMEPLVNYAAGTPSVDGSVVPDFTKFAPALAESWSFDDASHTWTFKLRHDVKSCAGNNFTADDVLYTFARAKSRTGTVPIGFFLAQVAAVDGFTSDLFANTPEAIARRALGSEVTKIDDYTVKIRLAGSNSLLLAVLPITGLLIYDHVEMQKHATPDDPWSHAYANNFNAPSFGPWCLQSWKREQEFTAEKNPNYYDTKPFFDRVIYRKVPQSANRIAILRSGQAQIVDGLNPQELSSLRDTHGVKVAGGYLNSTLILAPNWKSKPFDDVRIRQALAFATPYDAIIKSSFYGDAKQWMGLIPSIYPGYHQPATQFHFDPDKARALLAEAGYPGGKGLEQYADSFKLSYVAEREASVGPIVTLLRTRLREVGFPVELDPIPSVQFAQRQSVKRDMPLAVYDQAKSIGVDALYAVQLYFVTPPAGVINMMNYSNADVDALFNKARTEGDAAVRQGELDRIQDLAMRDVAYIPVVEYKQQYAMQDTLKGVMVHPAAIILWKTLTR
jgi:peptide/nickel transport system substrate-binding protein